MMSLIANRKGKVLETYRDERVIRVIGRTSCYAVIVAVDYHRKSVTCAGTNGGEQSCHGVCTLIDNTCCQNLCDVRSLGMFDFVWGCLG